MQAVHAALAAVDADIDGVVLLCLLPEHAGVASSHR
jgi:hypothetical protein